jgi:hypothetical protein
METRAAYDVTAGSFVAADLGGRQVLCLKAERIGKEHINHFLVPLDPVDDRRALALVYVDPDERLVPVEGVSFAFADGAEDTAPEIGDVFLNPFGALLKVLDDPHSQRLHAYVDITTGQVRTRMERHIHRLLAWRMLRI